MTHTDTQLKQALAKMLPDKLNLYHRGDGCWDLCWVKSRPFNTTTPVLDTELLHLCWLVEETLDDKGIPRMGKTRYLGELYCVVDTSGDPIDHFHDDWKLHHATWQQRTIALAKVKGIEIV